jgi:hypothetical protein
MRAIEPRFCISVLVFDFQLQNANLCQRQCIRCNDFKANLSVFLFL